ncbi:MAG: ribonuclease HII [Candidatus Bathyarchaeia archaeon]
MLISMVSIAGVDDAGRGPVLGPLVICGLLLASSKQSALQRLNVRDSKVLSPRTRETLYGKIIELADAYVIEQIEPETIDQYVNRRRKFQGLNLLEAEVMAKILVELKPDVAYIDASDVDEERFGRWVSQMLPAGIEVVSEHHADRKYPIVAASSIIAKVTRDREVERLKRDYGDFGSGYASDPRTRRFLIEYFNKNQAFPNFVRRSWKTLDNLKNEASQSRLI